MKKILITGANSYIGMSFEKFMSKWPEQYQVDTVDMVDSNWKEKSFAGYDAVFHVAGIAHIKETEENAHLYYDINCDLAFETAKKAKEDGVRQFVFLSSMSVYGMEVGVITPDTVPTPRTNYGKSKLKAEKRIHPLQDESFCVTIARPPMVYGKNCRGNFQMMLSIVKKYPVFPWVQNRRSMLYIDHLCAFIRIVVDEKCNGVFCPQNREYVNTSEMAGYMAKTLKKKVFFSHLGGWMVHMVSPFVSKLQKAFGTLCYEGMEKMDFAYCTESFEDTVSRSV